MGGNADAGFYGGQGVADAQSVTHHIEIPLDPFGTVFYSNLKDKNKKKPAATGQGESEKLPQSQSNKKRND
jgi:hypothetical protein